MDRAGGAGRGAEVTLVVVMLAGVAGGAMLVGIVIQRALGWLARRGKLGRAVGVGLGAGLGR